MSTAKVSLGNTGTRRCALSLSGHSERTLDRGITISQMKHNPQTHNGHILQCVRDAGGLHSGMFMVL